MSEFLPPRAGGARSARRLRCSWRGAWVFRLVVVLILLGLVVGGVFATSGVAWALPSVSLCPATPPPVTNPLDDDPSVLDPGVRAVHDTTRYGQRGYAGLTWSTYDTGCLPQFGAELDTHAGDVLLETAVESTAIWQGLSALATNANLDPTASAAGQTAQALFGGVFSP